jgi:N-acetylglucosaminyldiphosphoundecaprenol N-acetyl-beta-D-mannosaminyltransferase
MRCYPITNTETYKNKYLMNNIIQKLNLNFTIISFDQFIEELEASCFARIPGYAVFCSVHSLVTARDNDSHLLSLKAARWLMADGYPVAWLLRRLGYKQKRISGPDVMHSFLIRNNPIKKVYLLGSTDIICRAIIKKFSVLSPDIEFVGYSAPVIDDIDDLQNLIICDEINTCRPNIVWVGLGCPKQELWCYKWSGRIYSPVLAVGAAFDFLSGNKKRAPLWIQNLSLEWLFRLLQEPRRLSGRYFITNFKFIYNLFFNLK